MPKEPMSTFVVGGKEFEVVDKAAREYMPVSVSKYGFSESTCNNLGIFKCVKTWLDNNDKLYYGNAGNPNSFNYSNGVATLVSDVKDGTVVDNKYPLDCMSFVMMCLYGIGFDESIFGDKTNKSKYPKASLPYLEKEYCKYAVYTNPNNRGTLPDSMSWSRLLTWQFAGYLNDIGLFHKVNKYNLESLRPGDIVFFKSDAEEYSSRFEKIVHCAIYVGIGRFAHHVVVDCSPDNTSYPVRVRDITDTYADTIIGYSRIPVGMAKMLPYYSVSKPVNALRSRVDYNSGSTMRTLFLDRKIKKWDTYLVKFTFMYTDATIIGTIFPAICLRPLDYTFWRRDANTMPDMVVNEPIEMEAIVCFTPEIADIDNSGTQFMAFKMFSSQSNKYVIKVSDVIPIISGTDDLSSDGVWLPSITGTDWTSIVDTLCQNAFDYMDTVSEIRGAVLVNQNNYGFFTNWYRIIRYTSSNYQACIIDANRNGIVKESNGGTVTYTSYTSNSPAPFDLLSNIISD